MLKLNIRKYAVCTKTLHLGGHMARAKKLTKAELKRVLDVTNSCNRYPAHDVTMQKPYLFPSKFWIGLKPI